MAFRPRPRYLAGACLLLCALFLSTAARLAAGPALASASSSTTLYAVADASVHSQHPNTNYGAENYLRLAYSSIDVPVEEALILRFNLTSLPASATACGDGAGCCHVAAGKRACAFHRCRRSACPSVGVCPISSR